MATLRLGDTAPDFTQQSSQGPISFHDWAGDSWVVLFSHPADFTPVCTTELGRTAALSGEFAKRGVKPIAISVDPVDKHHAWIADIDATQNTTVNFPILADADRKVSELYDLIHPNASTTATVRSVFFIDPKKTVRATLTYPASTGRNFDELLRVVDSLQLTTATRWPRLPTGRTATTSSSCPACRTRPNWRSAFPRATTRSAPTCASHRSRIGSTPRLRAAPTPLQG